MLNKSEPYTTTAKPNIDHQHLNKCRPEKMVSKDSIPSWFTIHFGQSPLGGAEVRLRFPLLG